MAPQPTEADRPRLGGLPKVLAAAAAMGTLGPVAALAYGEGVGPATFSALRAGLGAAILAALVLAHRQPSVSLASLPRRQRRHPWAGRGRERR